MSRARTSWINLFVCLALFFHGSWAACADVAAHVSTYASDKASDQYVQDNYESLHMNEACLDDDVESVALLQLHSPNRVTPKIPFNLILMAKQDKLEQLPKDVAANVQKTLDLNKDMRLQWFSDHACEKYLEQHDELGLLTAFRTELRGSFRGDICRAAVLAIEGGFYQDVDVELSVPYRDLINSSTTFLTVWEEDNKNVLNAVIGVEPRSAIMARTVEHIKKWYDDPSSRVEGWMGPITLTQALEAVMKQDCPSIRVVRQRYDPPGELDVACGSHNLRFYQEQRLPCEEGNTRGCSQFDGLKYAFVDGMSQKLIGWPRFSGCEGYGCGGGGWDLGAYSKP